ncbi:shikimate kinase [Luteimonas sp. MC1750]|uniref:shikimate kinase n=1 Tax=Luteimonas sp. MC1750 TaxID=2799326 RepID=UPI0018F0D46D|nr:shikimate kinase [Luteimonas sp. MC1750]MBJ6983555.1 shikimate kinase [Luteimonas sp. MC1750]QQO06401.1 shikimate kinase [Luteimonas sp. MC1750]
MNPARHLVLVGPMGAGKTSIGRCLARHFGLAFVDSDHEIEQRTGTSVTTIFDCTGEAGFRARERDTLAGLLAGPGSVLATGGGAVLDAGSRRLMAANGFVVHLRADVPTQLERLARDRSRPLLAGGDREATLHRLAGERDPLYAEVADLVFDTRHLPAADAARRLAQQLDARWQRGTGPLRPTEPTA